MVRRFPERDLVPYEASVFPAVPALVLAPHADDEVFACGAAIASLRERGAAVTVVVLTDGAGDEPEQQERARIAEARRRESATALSALGGAELLQGPFADRRLGEEMERAAAFIDEVAGRVKPGLVFAPSPSEVHPDHRAAGAALLRLVRTERAATSGAGTLCAGTLLAFYEISQPIRPNFLLDATRYRDAKERAMACFASQLVGHDYAGFIRGLSAYRRMTLPREVEAAEGYFVVDVATLRRAPAGTLEAVVGPSLPPSAL